MGSRHSPVATEIPDWKWSAKEKAVARKAFDLALSRELDVVIKEAKDRAARISNAAQLWELEGWLVDRRRDLDGNFQFRYSVLPLVFATLLRNDQLSEDDLQGFAPSKLDARAAENPTPWPSSLRRCGGSCQAITPSC